MLLANTLKLLQWNKVDLCDLYKKIAACITDEGELESEIYQAEKQETPLLDKIAKVNFYDLNIHLWTLQQCNCLETPDQK